MVHKNATEQNVIFGWALGKFTTAGDVVGYVVVPSYRARGEAWGGIVVTVGNMPIYSGSRGKGGGRPLRYQIWVKF